MRLRLKPLRLRMVKSVTQNTFYCLLKFKNLQAKNFLENPSHFTSPQRLIVIKTTENWMELISTNIAFQPTEGNSRGILIIVPLAVGYPTNRVVVFFIMFMENQE